jgi:hypothetical protein
MALSCAISDGREQIVFSTSSFASEQLIGAENASEQVTLNETSASTGAKTWRRRILTMSKLHQSRVTLFKVN